MRRAMEKNLYLKRLVAVAAICLTLTLTASAQRKLTILHLNDTHSHVEPFPRDYYGQVGGVIERAAFIDSVRKAEGKRNVLLLHAGDFSQGTSYFTLLKGDIEIDLMNALKYDVTALGNHEFDNGLEDLARRLRELKAKVVCCNYDFSPFEVGQYVKPYVIVKRAGMKIGIIGLLTDVSSVVAKSVADRLQKLDDVAELNKWADYLRNEKKCDLVIALTHIGYSGEEFTDLMLVPKTRNLDVVVGGHSHTFLKKMESATDLDGRTVPIVQDGCWGQNVGVLTVIR